MDSNDAIEAIYSNNNNNNNNNKRIKVKKNDSGGVGERNEREGIFIYLFFSSLIS